MNECECPDLFRETRISPTEYKSYPHGNQLVTNRISINADTSAIVT